MAENQKLRRRTNARPPTILDVARVAGVSKSAVSLAIRNQPGVSETTRERILAVAQQMGYSSNVWARSLVSGRTGLVGVLLQDLGSSYHRDVTAGVEAAAAEEGLRVVIGHGGSDPVRLRQELNSLLALGVEAVVVISSWVPPHQLEQISKRLPVVVVGRLSDPVEGVDTVANHDELGAKLAVEHLLNLGHERIAHLTGSSRPAAMHRRRAFADVLRARFPEAEPQVVGLGVAAAAEASGVDAAVAHVVFQLQHDARPPTAVFTQNDRLAAQLMAACLDAGLRLPEDLSVVGYDNSSLCTVLRPALSSVDQPRAQMGETALQMVVERLSGRSEDRQLSVDPTLVVRESSAALS